ncbi:Uncharacterized protein MA16_Dca008265 [Dendrobium catenatum]|uniref:Peptidase S54 rhomboid domain-containing protein n=1 Tax=Dendrobium catenatum TaxID=906689 RepID=A0A2I0X6M3_9ASPA|nr:Uncharacterized protein MA16_Dca008265 [Dendrobium catenatum]
MNEGTLSDAGFAVKIWSLRRSRLCSTIFCPRLSANQNSKLALSIAPTAGLPLTSNLSICSSPREEASNLPPPSPALSPTCKQGRTQGLSASGLNLSDCKPFVRFLPVRLPTRLNQWWAGIPFITSCVTVVCGIIYLVCLLAGYDSFAEICFLPSEVVSRFQVYRIYTAVLFHGSLLHVIFNMLALVPLGTELERIMGSVRLLYLMVLLATSNAIFHLIIALIVAHNPLHSYPFLMHECAIGFSGIIFSMIVIETSLSGIQTRSVFGLFNVPAKWYAWILLVLFQLLATNVSLLGHLCGILSGFAYSYGLFNYLLPGSSFYGAIESSSFLSACIRRPGFILCSGGATYGNLPTHLNSNTASSGLVSENLWRNITSWMPQRETTTNQSSFAKRARVRARSDRPQNSIPRLHSPLESRLLSVGPDLQSLSLEIACFFYVSFLHSSDNMWPMRSPDNLAYEERLLYLVSCIFSQYLTSCMLSIVDLDPYMTFEIVLISGCNPSFVALLVLLLWKDCIAVYND